MAYLQITYVEWMTLVSNEVWSKVVIDLIIATFSPLRKLNF